MDITGASPATRCTVPIAPVEVEAGATQQMGYRGDETAEKPAERPVGDFACGHVRGSA